MKTINEQIIDNYEDLVSKLVDTLTVLKTCVSTKRVTERDENKLNSLSEQIDGICDDISKLKAQAEKELQNIPNNSQIRNELYEKVYIRSEADLPKDYGLYLTHSVGLGVRMIYFDEKNKDKWIKLYDWYLRPVEADQEVDLNTPFFGNSGAKVPLTEAIITEEINKASLQHSENPENDIYYTAGYRDAIRDFRQKAEKTPAQELSNNRQQSEDSANNLKTAKEILKGEMSENLWTFICSYPVSYKSEEKLVEWIIDAMREYAAQFRAEKEVSDEHIKKYIPRTFPSSVTKTRDPLPTYHNKCDKCGEIFWTKDAFNNKCPMCGREGWKSHARR